MNSNYRPDPDTGVTPDFFSLLALFYPSVTGIMAGSNRSAVLANPGVAIPVGTIRAISVTTVMYISVIWLFGTSLSNEALMADKLIVTAVAYPHNLIVKMGIIMSCIGAGLQCMAGAPRLLAAIAADDCITFLRPFAPKNKDDEPVKAIWLTWFIASLPVLAGNLDFITPIITLFFLLMYAGVNLSCFVLSILRAPGFRPSFKYYHWSISLFGFFWCLGLGLVISWATTLVAVFLFIMLYLYIRAQGATKEWGDAVRGLRYGIARDELSACARLQAELQVLPLEHQLVWVLLVPWVGVGNLVGNDLSRGLSLHHAVPLHSCARRHEGVGRCRSRVEVRDR